MNNLEKYLDQVIEQKPAVYEPAGAPAEAPQPPEEPPTVNLLASVRRRWYIVVLVTIVLSALALPAILLVVQPQYVVQGAVHVRPVVPGILEPTSPADVAGYGEFINTQAMILMSNNSLLQDVADALEGRNLAFLSGTPLNRMDRLTAMFSPRKSRPDAARILREAIAEKIITATTLPRTDLIGVAMRTANAEEAKTIVNQFLNSYRAQFGSRDKNEEAQKFNLLTDQLDNQAKLIKKKRDEIRLKAEPYGTISLAPVEEMKLNVQAKLIGEMINLESQKVAAQTNVDLLKNTRQPELPSAQIVRQRREYVNSDPMVAELSRSIVSMERDLITQRALVKEHPRLLQEQTALESLKARLEAKRKELEEEYDKQLTKQQEETADQRLAAAELQLRQIEALYKALSDRVERQDTQTQQVGRTNMDIQDLQSQLQVDQDQYDMLYRRLKSLDMEQRRPIPRIDLAYEADVVETNDRRPQLATAAVLGALACGFALAFLRDRMDKTLQTPADVERQIDLPVLGTTTSSHAVKPALLAEQIASDYQTIRTNLGLAYDGGLPRKLVVSSAGTREGKTTFAVNLATSLAKSGKRVLLIDGDLRKPDVGQMLSVPKDTGYLQDLLLGGDSSRGDIAYVSPSSGLHILAANPRHMADPYELLTSAMAAEQIERLAREYDHVVIDSPPALAFPDALVWAKLADAVVLISFAGQTTGPELKEAKERFARGRARVLGAVLSNVSMDQSLYRYAYTYRARSAESGRKAKKLLLAAGAQKPGDNGGGA